MSRSKTKNAEYARIWRLKNPDKSKQIAARSREKNRAKRLLGQANWRPKNLAYVRQKNREWQQAHPENRALHHRRAKAKKYGITLEIKANMYAVQSGRCAICKTGLPPVEHAHIDHCHSTKKVRGLLCRECNTGLGLFRDNKTILQNAIDYLERTL